MSDCSIALKKSRSPLTHGKGNIRQSVAVHKIYMSRWLQPSRKSLYAKDPFPHLAPETYCRHYTTTVTMLSLCILLHVLLFVLEVLSHQLFFQNASLDAFAPTEGHFSIFPRFVPQCSGGCQRWSTSCLWVGSGHSPKIYSHTDRLTQF